MHSDSNSDYTETYEYVSSASPAAKENVKKDKGNIKKSSNVIPKEDSSADSE